MAHLIDKDAVVAEIERIMSILGNPFCLNETAKASLVARKDICEDILSFINTLEVKEVDLMLHTIIAECCDWLAMNTELSHDEIEGCHNLMLTVKEEQCKNRKKNSYGKV